MNLGLVFFLTIRFISEEQILLIIPIDTEYILEYNYFNNNSGDDDFEGVY